MLQIDRFQSAFGRLRLENAVENSRDDVHISRIRDINQDQQHGNPVCPEKPDMPVLNDGHGTTGEKMARQELNGGSRLCPSPAGASPLAITVAW